MPPRKRNHVEIASDPAPLEKPRRSLLDRIRNMSEFAALVQYLNFFGAVVKAETTDVEQFEQECLASTHSPKLTHLGLVFLKIVSSHRGLTLDNFEEYTRRQYLSKAPALNPFGSEDEEASKFSDLDIFTKIRVLHQLSEWTFWNPDKIREKMPETFDEQCGWRMDPCGWDAQERSYFVFDDYRLYRQTDPPIAEPPKKKAKSKPKKGRKGARLSLRRSSRQAADATLDAEDIDNDVSMQDISNQVNGDEIDNDAALEYEPNFEGRKWECVAITLQEYQTFLDSIQKSKDPDERTLREFLSNDILPSLLKEEERRQRIEQQRLKEMENIHKLAYAKRSGRLAEKAEKQKEREEAEEAERKRLADLAIARKEQLRQNKMESAHESRMMTREQRFREREAKRILHEDQILKEQDVLQQLGENGFTNGDSIGARMSERQLKADVERRRAELEQLQQLQTGDDWEFDCSVCGMHGKNLDDGSHSIACEKCNVWQHSTCHGIEQVAAASEDFHFECKYCKQKEELRKLADVKTGANVEFLPELSNNAKQGPLSPQPMAFPIAPPLTRADGFLHYQPNQSNKFQPIASSPSNGFKSKSVAAALVTPKQQQQHHEGFINFASSFNSVHSSPPPPTPHLPSPHPRTNGNGVSSLSVSQSGLQGSSPGYSPIKQPSPPRPAHAQLAADQHRISPPILFKPLEPRLNTSVPVKPVQPIHSSPIQTVKVKPMVPELEGSK